MKLETETNGLRHGFWGTMVPHGAQSNSGGRSKEAYPPKPMPSFASGDISARRSSWLSISIYLQNFDMYIFIRINEMCIYIYICVCLPVLNCDFHRTKFVSLITRFQPFCSDHEPAELGSYGTPARQGEPFPPILKSLKAG